MHKYVNKPIQINKLKTNLDILESHFGIVSLGLQLKLNVEEGNFWVCVGLGLHFKASVRESLLEGHTLH